MLQMASRMRTIYGFLLESGQEAPVTPLLKVEEKGVETIVFFGKLGRLLISKIVKTDTTEFQWYAIFFNSHSNLVNVFYLGLEYVSLCCQWQAPSQQK